MPHRRLALLAGLTVAGCTAPRSVEPLSPRYPNMLRSAGTTGTLAATIRLDRHGEVKRIRVDDPPGVHELFRVGLQRDLETLRFAPARVLGFRAGRPVAL